MGKSAGKWIKTVLFGKKHSKSSLSKNGTPDKNTAAKTPLEDLDGNSPVISETRQGNDGNKENLEIEKGTSGPQCDTIDLSPGNDVGESQSNAALIPVSDAEMRRQEEAASKAQAAFRGYLARRAFRALKGIIRLQALIRGHLVRRQAVSTLRCMQGIIKLQALARGRKVRLSDSGDGPQNKYNTRVLQDSKQLDVRANSFFGSEKLATNKFVCKLLITMPTAMPLSLQYDVAEPNSYLNWLERWSVSRFWEPPTRNKRIMKAKPQKKPIVEPEAGKSRRTIRKVPTVTNGEVGVSASSEMDKPKRNPRKVASNQTDPVQDQPQNELERVKRNLRKVAASATPLPEKSVPEKLEPEPEKPQPLPTVEIVPDSAPADVCEEDIVISSEKAVEADVAVEKPDLVEAPVKPTMEEPIIDVPYDNPLVDETHSSENGLKMESALNLNDEVSCKEEQSGKENSKIRKRRSLPTKQEYPENIAHNSPTVPSYMAATESAKAKLRAQGSSKFGEDGAESGNARRHSLPASTNGKLSSLSPRIQKPVHSNGKGATKTNRLLISSRDDKGLLPGWKR